MGKMGCLYALKILKKLDFKHYHYLVENVVPKCFETREIGENFKNFDF